jgi:SAM-dependent methyltransferase
VADRKVMGSGRSRRGGTSARTRAAWRLTYEESPYDQLPWFEPGPSPQVKLAVESGFLPKGAKVLDIGCGAGSNVLYLALNGLEAHGVDLSPGAVAAARSRAAAAALEVHVEEGDALALPVPDASFDALVDNGCFHTIPIRRRRRYAEEVHRVLRREGRLVLSWVAREHVSARGPPHRPSLGEVTALLEPRFLFLRTGYQLPREAGEPPTYFAFLGRRTGPYPPPR